METQQHQHDISNFMRGGIYLNETDALSQILRDSKSQTNGEKTQSSLSKKELEKFNKSNFPGIDFSKK